MKLKKRINKNKKVVHTSTRLRIKKYLVSTHNKIHPLNPKEHERT